MAGEKRNYKKNEKKEDLPVIYGKVSPNAQEVEKAILGLIMIERGCFDIVTELLKPDCFYKENHQIIFKAMQELNRRFQIIDILTVCEQLRGTGELELVGGAYYVTTLTNFVVGSANLENYCRIVFQKYLKREMIRIGHKFITDGYEDMGDVFEMIDDAERDIYNITNSLYKRTHWGMDSLLVKQVKEIELRRNNQQSLSGVTSGFHSVDAVTHGWQKTDLIVMAARPGVGKTAFALNLARNADKAGTPVAFFSLEMSAGQLTERLMSAESEIALAKIRRGNIDDAENKILYTRAVQGLSSSKMLIDDTPALNVFELRAKARRMKTKFNIGMIIIDYLQLMSGAGTGRDRNREQEISEISRNLKGLAKELDIPIIALSQLSRETEKRADKSPMLSDLRESGAIEQDADIVVFLYRGEYYGIHHTATGDSEPGQTIVKFAKNRSGTLDSPKLIAQLWIQKFIEPDPFSIALSTTKTKGVDFKKRAAGEKDNDGITPVWKQIEENDNTFK